MALDRILHTIHGNILEVGSGDGSRKIELLSKHKKILKYTATDFSDWDQEFSRLDHLIMKYPILSIIFNMNKKHSPDKVCDALNLPYKQSSFDFHLSFEVLEHIHDPDQYFREAVRVCKKGGHIVLSVPYLYRMHGGEPDHRMDYFRYSNGFFHKIAKQNKLKLKYIYSNTGYGTTMCTLTNQWLIRNIFEKGVLSKILYTLLSILLFPLANILGYIIDMNPDSRFSTRLYVTFVKM